MKKGYRTLKGAEGGARILENPVYKAGELDSRLFGVFSNPEKLWPDAYLAGNSISTEAAKGWGGSPFRLLAPFHILSLEDASHIRSHDPPNNRNPYHAQRQ
ncbi:hypothetical protein [Pseudomonas sp. TAF7]|uniref:hypothetical protein n=1 Tax=Pseudomonas sp. TAF7 TaxID=3233073 RepID=UPI003F97343D